MLEYTKGKTSKGIKGLKGRFWSRLMDTYTEEKQTSHLYARGSNGARWSKEPTKVWSLSYFEVWKLRVGVLSLDVFITKTSPRSLRSQF